MEGGSKVDMRCHISNKLNDKEHKYLTNKKVIRERKREGPLIHHFSIPHKKEGERERDEEK